MELREFIKNTLLSIRQGIHDANVELAEAEGKKLGNDARAVFGMEAFNRDHKEGSITFDVAVTASEQNTVSGGGKVSVAVVDIGGDAKSSSTSEKVSRIKFHILPSTFIA